MSLLATALFALASLQAEPVVNAHLSTGVVRLGSELSLVVDVEGTQNATLGDLAPVDGLRFGKVGPPSVEVAESIVGRTRTRTIRQKFLVPIAPERTGNFTIPPAARISRRPS
jgi:hypothetical protein